jgi:hypothetical protein
MLERVKGGRSEHTNAKFHQCWNTDRRDYISTRWLCNAPSAGANERQEQKVLAATGARPHGPASCAARKYAPVPHRCGQGVARSNGAAGEIAVPLEEVKVTTTSNWVRVVSTDVTRCSRCKAGPLAWQKGKSGQWYLCTARRNENGTLEADRRAFHDCPKRFGKKTSDQTTGMAITEFNTPF